MSAVMNWHRMVAIALGGLVLLGSGIVEGAPARASSPAGVATTQAWKVQKKYRLPLLPNSISCPSTSDCWTVGIAGTSDFGAIAHSIDGGKKWKPQALPSGVLSLESVSCANISNCTAVGSSSGGVAVSTIDGGATWQA